MVEHKYQRAIKMLSRNDLGLTGSHQAGILVPKNSTLHVYLPKLNAGTRNPSTILTWWCDSLGQEIETRFVYYNGRPLGFGTRNEFRITRLTGLLRDLRAQPGDSLVLEFFGPTASILRKISLQIARGTTRPNNDSWIIEEVPFDT
jgi:hypothetical protein